MPDGLVLHEDARSGNCYKIRLTAAYLGIPLVRRAYDIISGETRSPDYLANVNPNGKIPVLQIGERFLPESNAACLWLAHGSALIPEDRFDHADMLRWMFWEQYSHEPNVATMRFFYLYVGKDALSAEQRASVPAKLAAGEAALALMDNHLATRRFFVADALSLADICLYAYTHVSEEGGFDLGRWPNIMAWLARIGDMPGYLPMDANL